MFRSGYAAQKTGGCCSVFSTCENTFQHLGMRLYHNTQVRLYSVLFFIYDELVMLFVVIGIEFWLFGSQVFKGMEDWFLIKKGGKIH